MYSCIMEDPVITPNLDPAFGPVSGNTTVTVRGKLLHSSDSTVMFSIGTSPYQDLLSM